MKAKHYDKITCIAIFLMMFIITFTMTLATHQERGTCILIASILLIVACVSAMLEREAYKKEKQ